MSTPSKESGFVLVYPKGSKIQLSTHFQAQEFDCPCHDCKMTLIDKNLVTMLEALRTLIGSRLTITSGYRCDSYQKQLKLRGYETAKGISQHEIGMAADITNGVMTGVELSDYAKRVGFKAIGIGSNWIHVDMREDKERTWNYTR